MLEVVALHYWWFVLHMAFGILEKTMAVDSANPFSTSCQPHSTPLQLPPVHALNQSRFPWSKHQTPTRVPFHLPSLLSLTSTKPLLLLSLFHYYFPTLINLNTLSHNNGSNNAGVLIIVITLLFLLHLHRISFNIRFLQKNMSTIRTNNPTNSNNKTDPKPNNRRSNTPSFPPRLSPP